MELRPYQVDLVEQTRNAFRAGKRRVVVYGPTGCGKTEVGMEMVRLARKKGTRVIFVANRIGLVEQASRRFFESGIDHGILQGDNTRQIDAGVLVCSIDTMRKRGFPEAGLILIDEAHATAANKAYRDLIMRYPGCPVIGLTATPFSKGLGKKYPDFGELFEVIAKAVTIRDLIRMGYLVDVEIWAPAEPDLSGVKVHHGDYDERQLGEAVDKPELIGDIVAHWKRLGQGKQTVCFATNIAHSKHIAAMFNAAGITSEHIDCYTTDDERREILARVNRGDTRVVTNCAVLAEGWDQPAVENMICARPTKSLIRWIQMAGRILRPIYPSGYDLETLEGRQAAILAGGKTIARIIDHSASAKDLGFPTDDLPLQLDTGKPRKAGQEEKKEPLAKVCPSCQYLKPPKVHKCPKCGFAPEKQDSVEVEDGNLARLVRGKTTVTTEELQQHYREFLGYARSKGYKDGWAYFACQELFDRAPRIRMSPLQPGAQSLALIKHLTIRRAKRKAAEQAKAAA